MILIHFYARGIKSDVARYKILSVAFIKILILLNKYRFVSLKHPNV